MSKSIKTNYLEEISGFLENHISTLEIRKYHIEEIKEQFQVC